LERGSAERSLDWDHRIDRIREALAMTKSFGRSRRAVAVAAATIGGLACLSACSGTGSGAETAARAGQSAAAPAGPCDKAQFAAHSGLAAGAIQAYVWQPVKSGALKPGARGRATAIDTARRASAFAAHELETASPLVSGCAGGIRLNNALATGRSLASSASKQLASKSVNQLTLAGANSIATTVLQEARAVGIDVKPVKPTARQLAAATAG
jgi:hypothetical protein